MDWILLSLVAVLTAGALALLLGLLLPLRHLAAGSIRLSARPRRVWQLVSSFAEQPAWRPDLLEVERLPDVNGRPVWRERSARGSVTFVVDEYQPPHRMTVRVADRDLGFGGTRTYAVADDDGGTRLTVVERGQVRRPLHRVLSRLLVRRRSGVQEYLEALARAQGELIVPETLRDESRIERLLGMAGDPGRARRNA